jgi:hypothetical protein
MPYDYDPSFPLIQQRNKLATQVATMDANLTSRERGLQDRQMLKRQGLKPNVSDNDVLQNLNTFLPPWLSPGNLGDLNRVIWPFWFTFTAPQLPPNKNSTGVITVTQEAAFVWMSFTKVVFKQDPITLAVTAIDPDVSGAAGKATDLTFSIKDAQSTRLFTQLPVTLDTVGVPRFPTTLPSPLLFLPNSTVEVSYFNADPVNQYIPFITFFGYRVRIDEAQKILSTITG